MEPLTIAGVLAALIAATCVVGTVVRLRTGRVRIDGQRVDTALIDADADVTLLQLSSPVCSACAAMRRVGGQLSGADARIGHRELDVTEHPELVRELGVVSTPTTLVVDRDGRVRSRIIGAATPTTVRATIEDALGTPAGAVA